MKRISYIIIAALIMTAMNSCRHDAPVAQEPLPAGDITFTAYIDNSSTKTLLDASNKVCWVSGDAISVNGAVFTATPDEADPTKAVFSLESGTVAEGAYQAYYPTGIIDGGAPVLPKQISYDPAGFDMPMYASSETTSLRFKNLCGVFAITVKSSQFSTVSSVTISSDNLAMSGPFSVSEDSAVLEHPATTYNDVTVNCAEPVTVSATGTPFYIPVPAATYSRIRICVSGKSPEGNDATLYMATRAGRDITVERSSLYPITFASNITIARETVANSSNAEDTDDERH